MPPGGPCLRETPTAAVEDRLAPRFRLPAFHGEIDMGRG